MTGAAQRAGTGQGRRCVIHVGPHKTATTYIQENLAASRDLLQGRGWLYPLDPHDPRSGHHGLALSPADYAPEGAGYHDVIAQWAATACAAQANVVLSAEAFVGWSSDDFAGLARALGFDSYELIYVIRDALDLFPSLWAEEVKHGKTESFPERFARAFLQPLRSRILNPLKDIGRWENDARAQLHIVPYDLLHGRGVDMFTHFSREILGVEGVDPALDKIVNPKNPLEITEFLRLLTLMHFGADTDTGTDLRERFAKCLTPKYAQTIIQLMQVDGADARRSITVPEKQGFQMALELQLKKQLAPNWTVTFAQDDTLFSLKKRVFEYYDAFLLSRVPSIQSEAERVMLKLYP